MSGLLSTDLPQLSAAVLKTDSDSMAGGSAREGWFAWKGVSNVLGSMSSVRSLCSGAENGWLVMRCVGSGGGKALLSRPLPANFTSRQTHRSEGILRQSSTGCGYRATTLWLDSLAALKGIRASDVSILIVQGSDMAAGVYTLLLE